MTDGRVIQVNVSAGGVPKLRVAAAQVGRDGLEGDAHDHDAVHGGPHRAVCLMAIEAIERVQADGHLGVEPGAVGENLTTSGIDVTGAVVGEHWAVGSAVLEVSQPRTPCFKLGIRMGDQYFPPRFAAAGRPGAYLRIVSEGDIAPGDAIRVLSRPRHGVTVGLVERAYHADRSLVPRLLDAPELTESWIDWAHNVLAHRAPGVEPAPEA